MSGMVTHYVVRDEDGTFVSEGDAPVAEDNTVDWTPYVADLPPGKYTLDIGSSIGSLTFPFEIRSAP